MAQRITYTGVDEEAFYTHHAHSMHGRFNSAALNAPASPDEYLLMVAPQKIIGFAKLFFNGPATYVSYLEIAKDARGQGYGPRLFARVFGRAAQRGDALIISNYTPFGRAYLMPHQARLERRYYPHLLVTNATLI